MASTTDRPEAPLPRRRLTASEVREYLLAHPGFFTKNSDVLEALTLPGRPDADGVKVIDFQRAQVDRLRTDNIRLRHFQSEVITAARANVSALAVVHEAVLHLLEAPSFEQLIHTITEDLAGSIGIDVVALGIESVNEDAERPVVPNLHLLEPGTIDAFLGLGRNVSLLAETPGDPRIFGPAAELVQSQALVRLDLGSDMPLGLLALGSRDPVKYEAGQGSELLGFLALTIERLIQLWLRQDNG